MAATPLVQPGDIISSNLINSILSRLQQLEDLMAQGSTPSQVVITGFEPSDQVPMGQVLAVNGNNFAFPPTDNTVTVGGQPVTNFELGSTSTRLSFIVPTTIPDVTSGGKQVVVIIATPTKGTTQAGYKVLPALATTGNPPTITNITRTDGTPNLMIGQEALIVGTNFVTGDTRVRMLVPLGNNLFSKDPSSGPSLTLTSVTPTLIKFNVPDITEITISPKTVQVEVGVDSHPVVTRNVSVRRT
jgi:hypothetical protein